MAVDVCSEVSSLVVSPRISFSHDLKESDIITPVQEPYALISTVDFDFCITTDQIFSQEISSADELFANGKIRPVEVKKSTLVPPKTILKNPTASRNTNVNVDTKRKMLKELLYANSEEDNKPSPAKPFWQFRRSSSLNFDYGRSNGLIRSLPFLSRSNSTGSAKNRKPSVVPRPIQMQNSPSVTRTTSSPNSSNYNHPMSSSCNSSNHSHQLRPSKRSSSCSSSPLKKSWSVRSYGSLRISPVLNIPPTYISKATLFGLGSLFCNGKSKKKKK